jgi:hypothetical protein
MDLLLEHLRRAIAPSNTQAHMGRANVLSVVRQFAMASVVQGLGGCDVQWKPIETA